MQTGKDPVQKGCNQIFFLKKGYQQVESAGPKDGGGTQHQRF